MNRKDIKIIQVSSEPEKDREIKSHDSLSKLGYRYIRIINHGIWNTHLLIMYMIIV